MHAGCCQTEEVTILRNHYPTITNSPLQVHFSQSQVVLIGDPDSTLTLMFVPDDDVLHRDPMSCNTWLPAGDAGVVSIC